MAQPGDTRLSEDQPLIATVSNPLSTSGDASMVTEKELLEEIQRLRVGLESADSAYARLSNELTLLCSQVNQPHPTLVAPRLAPMSRING